MSSFIVPVYDVIDLTRSSATGQSRRSDRGRGDLHLISARLTPWNCWTGDFRAETRREPNRRPCRGHIDCEQCARRQKCKKKIPEKKIPCEYQTLIARPARRHMRWLNQCRRKEARAGLIVRSAVGFWTPGRPLGCGPIDWSCRRNVNIGTLSQRRLQVPLLSRSIGTIAGPTVSERQAGDVAAARDDRLHVVGP